MSGAVPRLPLCFHEVIKENFTFFLVFTQNGYHLTILARFEVCGSDRIAVLRYKTPCSLVEVTDVSEAPVKNLYFRSLFLFCMASFRQRMFELIRIFLKVNSNPSMTYII